MVLIGGILGIILYGAQFSEKEDHGKVMYPCDVPADRIRGLGDLVFMEKDWGSQCWLLGEMRGEARTWQDQQELVGQVG